MTNEYEDREQLLENVAEIERRSKKLVPSELRSDLSYLASVIRRLLRDGVAE